MINLNLKFFKQLPAIVLGMLLFAVPHLGSAAILSKMKVISTNNKIVVQLQLDQSLNPRVFTLANPHRLVIDLPKTTTPLLLKNTSIPLPILAIRSSNLSNLPLRIVFDLKEPIQVTQETVLKNNSGYQLRIEFEAQHRVNSQNNTVPTEQIQSATTQNNQLQFTAAQPAPNSPPPKVPVYVDVLIDPTQTTEAIRSLDITDKQPHSNIYHAIDFHNLYRQASPSNITDYSAGLSYRAYKSTTNFGRLSFDMTALYEPNNNQLSLSNQTSPSQLAISHYSLAQHQFPITELILMDNQIGTHRLFDNNRHNSRFISRRFTANTPNILGFSSRVYKRDSALSLSFGEIGNAAGRAMQGFDSANGRILSTQYQHSFDKHFVSFNLWQTSGRTIDSENRVGYRGTLDSILPNKFTSSVTAAFSGSQYSFLAGLEQNKEKFKQSTGFYYYSPDFQWIDRLLGSDSAGTYYYFSKKVLSFNYGGSVEWQRIGLDSNALSKQNTFLFASNVGYRLNRTDRLNLFYRYHVRDDLSGLLSDRSSKEHAIRGFLNLQHSANMHSNISLSHRILSYDTISSSDNYTTANYSVSRKFDNGTNGSLSLEYTRNSTLSSITNTYDILVGYQKHFDNHQLNINAGYLFSNASNGLQDTNWTASISDYWTVSDHFSISANLNYNRSLFKLDVQPNQLVTNTAPIVDDVPSEELSVSINLSYNFGGNNSSPILSQRIGKNGAGRVHGRVIIDSNDDGLVQANEKGLANIDVYLDSAHLTRTDQNGYFTFASVGVGEHQVFIDESNLPLPWSLDGKEFHPITVNLRATSEVIIPITTIEQNN